MPTTDKGPTSAGSHHNGSLSAKARDKATKVVFTKMHGAGNDYIVVNTFKHSYRGIDRNAIAVAMSHRHFGVGGDGVIFVNPPPTTAGPDIVAEMEMYNSDGSYSRMCGNGLRIVAAYVYTHGICKKETFSLWTGGGMKEVKVHASPDIGIDAVLSVTVNMGRPLLSATDIPTLMHVRDDRGVVVDQTIEVAGMTLQVTCVNMGNPHCVVFIDSDVDLFPVEKIGPLLEAHACFPERTNVEFVQVLSPNQVKQRTYERGSGETWACGSGACAVCVAGVISGRTRHRIVDHLLGGSLNLSFGKRERSAVCEEREVGSEGSSDGSLCSDGSQSPRDSSSNSSGDDGSGGGGSNSSTDSGAAASVASRSLVVTDRHDGSTRTVALDRDVIMTGPAEEVFRGVWWYLADT
eukprot:TRINITY_DN16771_c0_g1_i1.p1 TRINITY_DN16771_c0_g1~~TRINITY_DN16771_c0_g1_i1.p1  ORF type:complete len:406 (+),score=75.43 TRINITY_DN16771_c0_g1_i1:307-1524(+)